MSKLTALCMVSLLLLLMLPHSLSRPVTVFHDVTPMETHQHHAEKPQIINTEEGCEGSSSGDEEECMMRRALQAHLDYIYTQREKQP